jgi:hypothetical protein
VGVTPKIHSSLFVLFCALLIAGDVQAADPGIDYFNPPTLTGTLYADSSLKQELFTFRREATSSGSEIHVVREFHSPDGAVAARESVMYESGQLKSFLLEELQTGAKGSAVVQSAGGEPKITFKYTEGSTKKSGTEKFTPEILASDMVAPYMLAHWDALMSGSSVKCRLISVSRAETVGFKFFKASETTFQGKPVVVVTLQPSSIIIARLVDPLHFYVEKGGSHRLLQYVGRTTPSIRKNGKWDDLDAVTVFDWK